MEVVNIIKTSELSFDPTPGVQIDMTGNLVKEF